LPFSARADHQYGEPPADDADKNRQLRTDGADPQRVAPDFLAFVRGRIAECGHGPLWREVPLDSDGRRNDNTGNIVNAWLHDTEKGAGTPKSFY
jgi:hypothetical protein